MKNSCKNLSVLGIYIVGISNTKDWVELKCEYKYSSSENCLLINQVCQRWNHKSVLGTKESNVKDEHQRCRNHKSKLLK